VLLGGARGVQVEHLFHGLGEIVRDVFQLDAAGLDRREAALRRSGRTPTCGVER
jgi:hypothetical protein